MEEAVNAGWLKIESPTNQLVLRLLKRDLDEGEAEAIALTAERGIEMVLLDESYARKKAAVYGMRKTGVIGLLIRAKLEGKVFSLRYELTRLRQDAGFRISDTIYREALRSVDEDPTEP